MADDQLKNEITETVEEVAVEATETIDNTAHEDVEAVEETTTTVEEAAEETVAETIEETTEAVENIEEAAEEAVEAVTEEVVETVEETTEAIEDAEEVVEEAAEANAEEAVEAEETVAEVAETVEDVAEAVEEAVAEVAEAVEDVAEATEETTEAVADAEETAEVAEEPVAEATESAVEEATDELPHIVGFTGEIKGKVYTLDQVVEEEEEEVTSAELMKMYESTLTSVAEHEIVTGRVVTIGPKDVVIDIGFKSDGIVARNEFGDDLEPGTEVGVYLERIEDRNGQLILSKRHADELQRWQRIESAYENDTIVEGDIVSRIKGGMVVDLFGTEAFLPGSQIDIRPVRDFDAYLNKRMEFKVVKINPVNGNVVVSHKALIEKDLEEQRAKILNKMEPGQVLEGIVKNITDFGVFIDLGGVDGLLHITDLSWGRVSHPSEMVELDQKLNVVVLDYDKDRKRISLGLKQLQAHPWDEIQDKYKEGDDVEGQVVSITDYGAFVELEKGIEGLVHISEMSWTKHVKHPTEMVQLGDSVTVKILSIDRENRKISLGMKQLRPDPWLNLHERFPVGSVIQGVVRNITNFGVFVELEPGIDGLVHISDLSWTKKIRHPGEIVKRGQNLDVVVLNIDEENRRLSLGHKQIETNPWKQFEVAYAENTDTPAKIIRFAENGIVVELPLEVEAFVPASQLLRKSDDLQNTYTLGEELKLRVIEFNQDDRKIILSERAITEAAERARVQKEERETRSRKKKERKEIEHFIKKESSTTGTLGELSQLASLKEKMEKQEAEERQKKAEAARKANKKAKAKAEKAKTKEETEEPAAEVADSVEEAADVAEAAEETAEEVVAETAEETAEEVVEEATEEAEEAVAEVVEEPVAETVEEAAAEEPAEEVVAEVEDAAATEEAEPSADDTEEKEA